MIIPKYPSTSICSDDKQQAVLPDHRETDSFLDSSTHNYTVDRNIEIHPVPGTNYRDTRMALFQSTRYINAS
ncbi:MAG TPA: hypothetical protein VH500_00090 [Nitrososphaeraceae archaeon]